MICLTFDTDWMTDRTLARFLRDFPIPGRATFFLHDKFPSLAGSAHELCPHPFIDNLGDWHSGLATLAGALPTPPRGVRPHSCVFSHMVGVELQALGYQYVSQATNLFQEKLAPLRHPWGIWELPIYYMDNMDFCMAKNWPDIKHEPFNSDVIRMATERDGLFVFDFHPIHIALNTRSHDEYQAAKRKVLHDGVSPFEIASSGRGVRTFFEALCDAMSKRRQTSFTCSEALASLVGAPTRHGGVSGGESMVASKPSPR